MDARSLTVFVSYAPADDSALKGQTSNCGPITKLLRETKRAVQGRAPLVKLRFLSSKDVSDDAPTSAIYERVAKADAFVAILSENWLRRPLCVRELELVVSLLGPREVHARQMAVVTLREIEEGASSIVVFENELTTSAVAEKLAADILRTPPKSDFEIGLPSEPVVREQEAGWRQGAWQTSGGATHGFGDLLRLHRIAANLTEDELAERAGLSSNAIYKFERAPAHQWPALEIASLADALRLSDSDREQLATTASEEVAKHKPPKSTAEPLPYKVQVVYFATDRKPAKKLTAKVPRFGIDRSALGQLSLGKCEVSIPFDHKTGDLETPEKLLWFRLPANPKKHIGVVAGKVFANADEFFLEIRPLLAAESSALVFVHGFNVTFEDAVRRTGQLANDLRFKGVAITYSWPSKGKESPLAYKRDESNIMWTEPHLEVFLRELQATGVKEVHVIAHSMGNRAVSNVLNKLEQPRTMTKFSNVVLAAPDIDRDIFLQVAPAMASKARVVTLYASDRDKALLLSKAYNGYPRAGDSGGGIVICSGIVSVDVSAVDTDFVGHGYYGDNTSILSDLFYLIRGDPPPRFRLEAATAAGGPYWKFVP
jgi:esterase/lipase superfamily enzyme